MTWADVSDRMQPRCDYHLVAPVGRAVAAGFTPELVLDRRIERTVSWPPARGGP